MSDDEMNTPADPQETDETPAGDTPEHADDDAAARGGSGAPADDNREPGQDRRLPEGRDYKSGVVGGEAEADPVTHVPDE